MAHAQAGAGKGCIMKVVRTRIVVALASSAVLTSAFGLTAYVDSSTATATTMLTASQSVALPCPSATSYDYCARY